jgi:hypothetical protein
MASLTCPNCGRDNPDFLDDCQFCQTPLRREATLNTGDNPIKKNTGELEKALPDWLQDARKQARDSAEEEAAKEAAKPKIQKEEPVDLLAGLAFQSASDEEEVPDWLASIRAQDKEDSEPSKSAPEEQPTDFFAQFEGSGDIDISPTMPLQGQGSPAPEESLPWLSGGTSGEPQKDELSDWFSQTSAGSNSPFIFDKGETPASGLDRFDTSSAPQPGKPEEPEDLSWLRDLEASSKGKTSAPKSEPDDTGWMSNLSSSAGTQDDLSWLNNLEGSPAPAASQPESQPEDLSWLSNLGGTALPGKPTASEPAPSKEENLDWLSSLGGEPLTAQPTPTQQPPAAEDLDWLNTLGGTTPASTEPTSTEPAKEDLSWLNNLGGTPLAPESTESTGAAPASAEDLSWLKDFGSTPTPSSAEPAPAQEDLGWLRDFSATPAGEPPTSTANDLSWLNELSGTPAPTSGERTDSPDNLDWLNTLGGTPATPSQEPAPFAETEVPDWLKDMEAKQSLEPAQPPVFSPSQTAPLNEDALQEMPDWLKSATEAAKSTSMPPLTAKDRPAEKRKSGLVPRPSEKTQGEPADEGVFSASPEPMLADNTLANQDVDALFAVDMPDWLSQPESSAGETSTTQAEGIPSRVGDELTPVELPSWVQAMRPVEAVMDDAATISTDQTTEREGPLAGLRGVIPFAPIGSSQRPKAISLKLQATAEQQAGALLVEQILAGESKPQPLKTSAFISSQSALRLGLAALFWVVLSAVIGFGTQFMPISAALPGEVSNISNVILALPEGAPVLVVMDYEPSLAGEMEATSGPLLDQFVVLRKPVLTFIASSPNGTGLVDRLLANTKISRPAAEGGLDYQAGAQYFNAGYLPGGLAGVRGFTEDPTTIMPSLIGKIDRFSSYQSVIILTDRAEAGQVWIEQLTLAKQADPGLANHQVLVVASSQAGPVLRPYISSNQVAGMLNGLPEAARYEFVNNSRPGLVRSYWDAFGAGLLLAILSIVLGSLWSLFAGIRARRAQAGPG